MTITEKIQSLKVVPVVVIKDINDTIPTLKALSEGGLPVAEITFRTACAADAIRLGVKEFPDMLIGAGTVINAEQANAAIDCGAKFIVYSPYLAEEGGARVVARVAPQGLPPLAHSQASDLGASRHSRDRFQRYNLLCSA